MRKTSRDRIASRPVLIENRLGKGVAMLVTLFEYPADEALADLATELLRVVSAGEQGEVRVIGSDRVRYAVYALPGGADLLYLQNLGTESVRVHVNEEACAVDPGETSCLDVPRRAAPGNCAFDADFLEEPPLPGTLDPRTPY